MDGLPRNARRGPRAGAPPRRLGLVAVAALTASTGLALVAAPGDAGACSFAPPPLHELDLDEVAEDTTPPSAPGSVATALVARGQGPTGGPCSQSATSCDDVGRIVLRVAPAEDDRTPAASLGYLVTLASGTLPSGLSLRSEPVRLLGDEVVLVWIDGATDDQEAFDFELDVAAVDLAGHVGPPVRVRVRDPGGGACAGSSGEGPLGLALALIALIALRARRHRPSTVG